MENFKKVMGMISMGLCLISSLNAASPFKVERHRIDRTGSDLVVDLRIDISSLKIKKNQTVVYTPLLQQGDSLVSLPPLIVNGRTRQIMYERREGKPLVEEGEKVFDWHKEQAKQVDYLVKIPYRKWMHHAELSMVTDLCECGWEALQNERTSLFTLKLEKPEVRLVPVFLSPVAEEVKQRSLSGQAYLDFPVNSMEIHPDYRRNPSELAAIRQTIESVRQNRYATITNISIQGFASPEGVYATNRRLAEGRAHALLSYVKGLYDLGNVTCRVSAEPEDWNGLAKRLDETDWSGKEEALRIVRAEQPADWDAREALLKRLPLYNRILTEIYPALRHSDYVVSYTIRNFTLEEAREVIYKDPSQLSLEEMHRVALSYPAGSDEYKEVFEIAVRMYPDDPVSNLNAANIALQNRQVEKARRYLSKAAPSPQKDLAHALLLMLEERWIEADVLLQSLVDKPEVADAARTNLAVVKEWLN